jgi:hypothetical protein
MSARVENIRMLEIVAKGLGELLNSVAFVGGATIALYLDRDPEDAQGVRATNDVDCVIEISTRAQFSRLERDLRQKGFKHSVEPGNPICRWRYLGVTVDVMPTSEQILGFSNAWYSSGLENTEETKLPSGIKIRTFPVAYVLAAKVEAFNNRGKGDFLASRDIEDLVTLLDGRTKARAELADAPDSVRKFLSSELHRLSEDQRFQQNLPGHLPHRRRNVEGIRFVLDIMRNIPVAV